ncbi:EAL domain-containing protein [Halomonas urumqiensis]|uniref:Diguanylate cyclase n=1 Tax=Halomonas urumqiensis TaxID=1684789 RepID=A0A2N7UNQ8_9GAMM|nr:EAL domain-containing protein [Halomonas urumqiensis]PMR82058.1 diguanylate cyclase [Halomonas urumqiensis]PTB02610.1 PAS domain S-box protein [Halomonas urumqiensis]GHE21093.1 hypothetical protein GCM10017767_16140 [Halomonas urumqiensis]
MQARIGAEDAFRKLAEGLGTSGSAGFFDSLVEQLARILDVDHVLIAAVENGTASTLAVWSDNQLSPNISYPLEGTPCESVVGYQACLIERDVQGRFPDDHLLEALGAQSYLGLPLQAVDGSTMGLMAVLKNSPMRPAGLEEEILRIAATQASAELGRRQAEVALQASELAARESERRLDTLLNHLPGMAYRCLNDPEWTMLIVSQGAKELTGYPAEALVGSHSACYANLIHPADRDRVFADVQAAINAREPFRVIYRLMHAHDGTRWMWEQGQAMFDAQGNVLHLEGFITDITEQHEAQRVQDAVVRIASTVTTRLGDDYFHQLLASLIQILEADAGFIALLDDNGPLDEHSRGDRPASTMSMISGISDTKRLDSVTFAMAGTPCERVIEEVETIVQNGSGLHLPGTSLHASAWIGRRLDNARGEPIGVIMVLYHRPLDANSFATSVLRILSTGAAAELERRRDHRRMHQLAYTDGTTGLPNRVRFMEDLTRLRQKAEKQQRPLALLLLDIRRFKEINDIHGHQVGDQLLATVAGRLQRAIGTEEVLARLSGDEFTVLVPKADEATLQGCLARMSEAISRPITLGHRHFSLEVSIGSALYPGDAVTAGELFKAASIALYHAKQQDAGVCPFNESMTQALQRRQQMTERLNQALDQGALMLYYQPQVDLASGQLTGAEALCRWHDPEWGWVSPGEFIPLAEERGLMRRLGDWVLREAARQMTEWRRAGRVLPGRLSINISAQQFTDPRLADHIASLACDVPASSIALELTESDFMRDPEQAVGITRALRDAGYALSIDDFGTGYSSLSYLRQFDVDTLKIDISFVREMLESHHDRAIVQTIIAMAKTLGMKTVAEGVETLEQAAMLDQMGCHQAQGYLFGYPLPAEEFSAAWRESMQPADEP